MRGYRILVVLALLTAFVGACAQPELTPTPTPTPTFTLVPRPTPTPSSTPTPTATLIAVPTSTPFLSPVPALAVASLSPQTVTVHPGDTFTLDLVVQHWDHQLGGGEVILSFDPQVFTALGVVPGPEVVTDVKTMDNENGTVHLAIQGATFTTPRMTVGTLATIEWQVREEVPPQEVTVTVVSAMLYDESFQPVSPVETRSALVEVVQSEWVRQRLEAVSILYSITPEGRELLARLDVRQMPGRPGYFGSHGFWSWTGLGEAKPTPVIHELGHAYWGAFPVTGYPSLSWEAPEGEEVSSAMQRYWDDVVQFLAQPPDPYEVFRRRLKNLPELSSDNADPLFHTVEADMVSMVGGDLNLVPPILRKYWDGFLQPGPFFRWCDAVTWYLGLPHEEKALADRYLGFQHLDLRQYGSLKPLEPTGVGETAREILRQEERQRLWDFAQWFSLLDEDPEQEESFKFWRGYLRDMRDIHSRHRGLLADSDLPMASRIAGALDFFTDIEGLAPEEKSRRLVQELLSDPFLAHFLPVLDNRALLELFASGAELPEASTLKGTASFVKLLERVVPPVDRVLAAGARSPKEGASALREFLPSLELDNRDETDLFFEILVDGGEEVARRIAAALDKETQRRLLKATPVLLRRLLDPPDLARALNITQETTPEQMRQGISLMIEHPSGNFIIDEPYLDQVYLVMAHRAEQDPRQMIEVIATSPFPVERFIYQHPGAAVTILSSDLELTTDLVKGSDPVVLPPARFVYSFIAADPAFAALVVERLDRDAEDRLVLESLAHLAYDKARVEANPESHVDLRKDGLFLQFLLADKGSGWLEERLAGAVELYQTRLEAKEVPADFLEAYQTTLEAAVATLGAADVSGTLQKIVKRVFE